MSDSVKRDAFTLKRWSQRKLAAARAAQAPESSAPSPTVPPAPLSQAAPANSGQTPSVPGAAPQASLPAIDSLTIDSDFSAFLQPDVDETLRRGALRKLFSDPRFNVMDGLDVYIDDYSKPDPLPAELVRQLVHARYIFDPPPTQVNAQGHVEDVPLETSAGAATEPVAAAPESLASAAPPPDASPTRTDEPLPVARDANRESDRNES